MLAVLTWNLDPVLLKLGPMQIRYYGVTFAATIVVAFFFWQWQMRRGGFDKKLVDRFLVWGVVATVAGARLGHCLFYEPETYLSDPVLMLFVWRGGLASHGATVGLVLALFLFGRRNKLSPLELMDRFAFSASIGAIGVRLANFLNSEIVGRVTARPWGIRFPIHELQQAAERNPFSPAVALLERHATSPADLANIGLGLPARHPSQLYEMSLALTTLIVLLIVDRLAGRERRPKGLLLGLFLTLYFGARFFLEFLKEYQTKWEQGLTAGQFLSVAPAVAGIALLWWSLKTRQPTRPKAR